MALTPLALITEITHRCPLHCVYCSNPLELTSRKEELATADSVRFSVRQQRSAYCIFTSPEANRWHTPGSDWTMG